MKELTVATSADDSTASENDAPNGGADAPMVATRRPQRGIPTTSTRTAPSRTRRAARRAARGGTRTRCRIIHESLQRSGRAARRRRGCWARRARRRRCSPRCGGGCARARAAAASCAASGEERAAAERVGAARRPPAAVDGGQEPVARIRSLPATVRRRIRKRLTGDQDKRVREHCATCSRSRQRCGRATSSPSCSACSGAA